MVMFFKLRVSDGSVFCVDDLLLNIGILMVSVFNIDR